ncbi:MAG: DUF6979 family protein [Candidatus Saliniplasma sp.]
MDVEEFNKKSKRPANKDGTQFGRAAVNAVRLIHEGEIDDPKDAWKIAVKDETGSDFSQEKHCPKCAFLGLL